MITIASNYAAVADDARESLKASAIQNTRKRNNSNKRKNTPEEQQTPDMVATTFSDKGKSSQHGRGRGSSSGQPRSSITSLRRHLPPYPTMSTTTCHASPIGMPQESAIKPTGIASLSMTSRRIKKLATNAPDDNGLVAKGKRTRKTSPRMAAIWKKTLRPNLPKRPRVELARVTHIRTPKRSLSHVPWSPHG
jgi:hypothetical protein